MVRVTALVAGLSTDTMLAPSSVTYTEPLKGFTANTTGIEVTGTVATVGVAPATAADAVPAPRAASGTARAAAARTRRRQRPAPVENLVI
jgi:hypothetical protein